MVIAIVVALILLRKPKVSFRNACSAGGQNAIMALANVCAIVGFGGVVAGVSGFTTIISALESLPGSNLVQIAVGVMICAGVTGSGSGGIALAMENLAPRYLEMGVDPQIIHRISAVASGSLDSLPHSGSIQSFIAVNKIEMKDGYPMAFVLTVVLTTAMLAFTVFLFSIGLM